MTGSLLILNTPLESAEMIAFAEWLRRNGIKHQHIANEGKRSAAHAKQLSLMGMRAGCPDMLVFNRVPGRPHVRGVAIEMKRRGGRGASPVQKSYLAELEEEGWAVAVAYGAAEAVKLLIDMGFTDDTERPEQTF